MAAVTPQLTLELDKDEYKTGETAVLQVTENFQAPKRTVTVNKLADADWALQSDDGDTLVYTVVVPEEAAGDTHNVAVHLERTWDKATADADIDLVVASAPTGGGVPGQVVGKTIIGMSTDDYAKRMAELDRPVGADHFFVSSWNPDSFIQRAKAADAKGQFPYGNMKVGDWGDFGSSAWDAKVTGFANQLAAFGKPVRVTFHHEPGFKSPTGAGEGGTAVEWVNMAIRQYPRIKAIAPNVVTGPVINGFILDPRTEREGFTFAELNSLFTDKFFESIDAFGGDYYDGSDTRAKAESGVGRAVLKIANADKWLRSRGVVGEVVADVGEYNFIMPQHADDLTKFFTEHTDLWWMALNFNSDDNNRDGIPTIGGGWNLSHGYNSQWDRRDAFRRQLDHALIHP